MNLTNLSDADIGKLGKREAIVRSVCLILDAGLIIDEDLAVASYDELEREIRYWLDTVDIAVPRKNVMQHIAGLALLAIEKEMSR